MKKSLKFILFVMSFGHLVHSVQPEITQTRTQKEQQQQLLAPPPPRKEAITFIRDCALISATATCIAYAISDTNNHEHKQIVRALGFQSGLFAGICIGEYLCTKILNISPKNNERPH